MQYRNRHFLVNRHVSQTYFPPNNNKTKKKLYTVRAKQWKILKIDFLKQQFQIQNNFELSKKKKSKTFPTPKQFLLATKWTEKKLNFNKQKEQRTT